MPASTGPDTPQEFVFEDMNAPIVAPEQRLLISIQACQGCTLGFMLLWLANIPTMFTCSWIWEC